MKSLLLASACLPEVFLRYSQRVIAKVCVITDWIDQILPFSLLPTTATTMRLGSIR